MLQVPVQFTAQTEKLYLSSCSDIKIHSFVSIDVASLMELDGTMTLMH